MTVSTSDVDSDALLVDAGIVRIRTTHPDDADGLRAMYERVSSDTVYLRFFSVSRKVLGEDVARLTRPSDDGHASLVAEVGGEIVGVATFERLDEPTEAEIAFVVDDEFQGRGVGMLLLEHLAALATTQGITRFVAETLPANARMLHVFADAGFPTSTTMDEGVVHVVLPLRFDDAYRHAVDLREAKADAASLNRVLAPATVAVVGAGSDPAGLGHQVLANVVRGGYRGTLYAVNRSGHRVAGVRAFSDLASVPGSLDVVVVAVPADAVIEVAHQAAARGVAGLVVISSGFAEVGERGAALQRELVRICRDAGMRLIGPNCMGIANTAPEVSLNATFSPKIPPAGGIGLMSQSGGIGIAAVEYAARTGVGISTFVSAGNKPDVSGNDLLCAWEADDTTQVCALYLESFGNPRKFARIAGRVGRSKPVVAVKSGRTVAGKRGTASHTAAAATPDVAVDSLFEQAGVTRVESLAELFDVATLFDLAPLPRGRRVAIVGNSGGPGVLAADACEAAGLEVVHIGEPTRSRLAAILPTGAAITNPIDLLAAADPVSYEAALRVVLDDEDVDAVLTVYTPIQEGAASGIARAIATVQADQPGKPLLACFLGLEPMPSELRQAHDRPVVPYYAYPEPAARALAAAVRYAEWRTRPVGEVPELDGIDLRGARAMVAKALAVTPQGGWLDAPIASGLVATHGVRVVPSVFARDRGEVAAAVVALGAPVVLKAAAGDLVHKSELGGVRLDLHSPIAAAEAFLEMSDKLGEQLGGVVVQPMVAKGVETAIGVVADPTFGPLVMVGLGGVASDLLADRAFRLLPLTREDAARQVRSLRAAPLLFGYRNTAPCDVGALEDMLLRVAKLAENVPEIAELDLNPVVVTPEGALAVDVKVRLAPVVGRDPLLRRLR